MLSSMKSLFKIWSYSRGVMQMLDRSPPNDPSSGVSFGSKLEPPVASSVSFYLLFFFLSLSKCFLRARLSFSLIKIWLSFEAFREKISSLCFCNSCFNLVSFSFKFSIESSNFLTYFLSMVCFSISTFLNWATSLF